MTTYIAAGPLVNYFFYNAPTTQGGPNIPLEEGKIYFYADEDHSVQLNSFSDVFNPNSPVVNPWPLRLGAAGECPIIYLEDRFYYIEIYDKNDVFQRSISHYSPGDAAGGSANDAVNYIPNGQFRLHNDLPATTDKEAGEIRAAITDIAYGGWTFERPSDSTATDYVTFERYDEYTTNPVGSPRFACRVRCTSPDSGDAYKKLCLKFSDVNKFASATQQYTVGFEGIDNLDADTSVEFYILKNFGTGGSPDEETLIETFTLTPTTTAFSKAFVFGANTGKVIGASNDDYVKLEFRFKTDEELDLKVVDFLQESGNITTPSYPATTDREDIQTSLGGGFPIPNPDGSDLGLQPILTKAGWRFDDSQIGMPFYDSVGYTDDTVPFSYKLCKGQSYPSEGYSDDGIPYKRLADKYWNDTAGYYKYGTGYAFVNAVEILGALDNLRLSNNTGGTITAPADGTAATGFTFSNISTGNTYQFTAGYSPSAIIVRQNVAGTFTASGAGTSGFTITDNINVAGVNGVILISSVTTPAGLGGKYFLISNTTTNYYVWFKVDGTGADPAIGGRTGIEIDLKSTYAATEVAQCITDALSGKRQTNILFLAGSAVPAASYWTFSASTNDFYVWYEKDGSGSDPAIPGKIGIKIAINSANTANDVCHSTAAAINRKYVGIPDYRSMFFRVMDDGRGLDPSIDYRFNYFSNSNGNQIGTIELDEYISHDHTLGPFQLYSAVTAPFSTNELGGGAGATLAGAFSGTTNNNGGKETRPLNIYVNVILKY